MIKRLAFVHPRVVTDRAASAPAQVRPVRAVSCIAVPELIADQVHDGVAIEWFTDGDHLARYARWLDAEDGAPEGGAEVVVAEEHVLRGHEWLEARWAEGGVRLKHMAIARRAEGLTPAQFSEVWQNRAGRVGSTPIPDIAKGCAYAQNHPVTRADGDWPYDAVNEVWFDDEDALRSRIAWMAEAVGAGGDDDFVGTSAFLAVREEVVIGGA